MQATSSTSASDSTAGAGGSRWWWLARVVWHGSGTLRWALAWLAAAELVVVAIAPLVVPDRVYLSLYLGPESRKSTHSFLENPASYLMWDVATGWRNRPLTNHGQWQVDSLGARTTGRVSHGQPQRRVWFLGDSTVNGGTAVANDQTMSACLEDDRTSTVNFGTMLFGLDQCYLLLRQQLEHGAPEAVVVGLSENSLDALGNRYVPFRRRVETNMPYLKPRFILRGGELVLIPTPTRDTYYDLLGPATRLSDVSQWDDYSDEFEAYRRCGFLPLSGAVWAGWSKARNSWAAFTGSPLASPLAVALMRAIERDTGTRGGVTVFLLLPSIATMAPSGPRRYLPNRYEALATGLRDAGFAVADAREILRNSQRPLSSLYHADGVHFTAEGNRIIASGLRGVLDDCDRRYSATPSPQRSGQSQGQSR